jgi:hypothetical protein
MDGLLLLVDFENAFDSIEWTFLRKALDSFNFGPSICYMPPLPEGGGGYTVLPLSVRPSVHPRYFSSHFSLTVDGRNLIFGHKHHIGIPYCG